MTTTEALNKHKMTRAQVDETCETHVCAECGKLLGQRADHDTDPVTWYVACILDGDHEGWRLVEDTVTQMATYGGPAYMNAMMAKRSPLFAGAGDRVIMRRLIDQYGLSPVQAAAGLIHAKKLGLDPFLNQIAFLTFRRGDTDSRDLAPMITEKGWAFLAHTHEPDEFMGMPEVKPMSVSEKSDYGWTEDDVAYWAIGTKKSWGDRTTRASAMVSKNEITQGNKGSAPTPLASDPHQHCRTRAIRRWYEQNYPALAKTVDGADVDASEIEAVIEGEWREVENEPRRDVDRSPSEATTVPMGEWAARCPTHGDSWQDGKYGPYHGLPRNGGFCNQRKVVNDLLKSEMASAGQTLGQTNKDTNDAIKEKFGATWSKLSMEDQITFVQELVSGAEAHVSSANDEDGAGYSDETNTPDEPVAEGRIVDWSDLATAVFGNFGKTEPELLAALGKTDKSQVTDFDAAYMEASKLWS